MLIILWCFHKPPWGKRYNFGKIKEDIEAPVIVRFLVVVTRWLGRVLEFLKKLLSIDVFRRHCTLGPSKLGDSAMVRHWVHKACNALQWWVWGEVTGEYYCYNCLFIEQHVNKINDHHLLCLCWSVIWQLIVTRYIVCVSSFALNFPLY